MFPKPKPQAAEAAEENSMVDEKLPEATCDITEHTAIGVCAPQPARISLPLLPGGIGPLSSPTVSQMGESLSG